MNNSDKNINKNLYKIFLILLKYTPMFLAIMQSLIVFTNFLGLNLQIISFMGGVSLPFIIMLFIMSYVFRFCYLYRIPLIYLFSIWSIATTDLFIGIPLSTINMFRLYAFVFGIFIITFVVYMYKNRNKPKVDYIKQMCENYSNCCG